jgi:hypothetical protein
MKMYPTRRTGGFEKGEIREIAAVSDHRTVKRRLSAVAVAVTGWSDKRLFPRVSRQIVLIAVSKR